MDFPPTFEGKTFTCPHCHVLSEQTWFNRANASTLTTTIIKHAYFDHRTNIADYKQEAIAEFIRTIDSNFHKNSHNFFPHQLSTATCRSCQKISVWIDNKKVYPRSFSIEAPNNDMESEIKEIYIEAATIYEYSPKGSTALLRLALQKLLRQIGKSGKDINGDIKELVTEGLSVKIQQALDLLRVIGNNAVHPGQIDLDDNSEIALKLFKILNFIADEMITKPKDIDDFYHDIIPKSTQEHIKQRDKK